MRNKFFKIKNNKIKPARVKNGKSLFLRKHNFLLTLFDGEKANK